MAKSVIVAFVSQKGGTGKSTLARALGAVVAAAGLKVRIADLDPDQQTVIAWERLREENRGEPRISVEAFDEWEDALASAEDNELLIIDAPAHANRGTLEIAKAATLIVQPTGASVDDLRPAVLLFHELTAAGIPKNRLAMALCRILTDREEELARRYVREAGYHVLPGCVPERASYRQAHNKGQAVTEAKSQTIEDQVDALMRGLYGHVVRQLKAARKPRKQRAAKRT